MVDIFSLPPFYTNHMKLTTINNSIPQEIKQNSKFWPYSKDALGAIDGSHINISAPVSLWDVYRNQKGYISQNCLFACLFSLQFCYALTGWKDSATDVQLWDNAINDDLVVPKGKYYLADAGSAACDQFLLPYQGMCCHLAEWGCANLQYMASFFNTKYLIWYL